MISISGQAHIAFSDSDVKDVEYKEGWPFVLIHLTGGTVIQIPQGTTGIIAMRSKKMDAYDQATWEANREEYLKLKK